MCILYKIIDYKFFDLVSLTKFFVKKNKIKQKINQNWLVPVQKKTTKKLNFKFKTLQ